MHHHTQHFRAMTLVELMMGLSLAVILMTAVSSALVAQTKGVRVNDSQMRSRQAANAAVNYILSKVRDTATITLLPANAPNGEYTELITLEVTDSEGQWTGGTYTRFFIVRDELLVQQYPLGSSPSGRRDPLLRGVRDVRFRSIDSGAGHQSVTVEMNVDYPDELFTGKPLSSYAIAGTAVARCTQ